MANEINNINSAKYGSAKPSITQETRDRAKSSENAKTVQQDQVDISQDAKSVERVSVSISESPSFDSAKVERITEAIREGRYPVNPERIAEKFLELEGQL